MMIDLGSSDLLAVWSVIGTLVGTLVGALCALALTFWAGRQVAEQARALWRAVRGGRGAVIGALDEPTDPAIRALADLSRVPEAVWVAVLPAFVSALADAVDRVVGESA